MQEGEGEGNSLAGKMFENSMQRRAVGLCSLFRSGRRVCPTKGSPAMSLRFYQAKCNGIKYSPRETRLRFWSGFRASRWLRVYFEANNVAALRNKRGGKKKYSRRRNKKKKRERERGTRSFFVSTLGGFITSPPEFSNLSVARRSTQDRAFVISVASSIKIQVCERGRPNRNR